MTLRMVLAGIAFLLSGVAALVYQVVWQRVLALHTGIGITSVAIIVASFMAGLGTGSLLGGVLSARVSPRRALHLFALVEAGIAAFGAASCWLYYDLLYLRGSGLYVSDGIALLLHFSALLVPTFLMGMSLPFLVRAVLRRADEAGRTVGFLYGVNMLGAALGAWLAPWILMRFIGFRGATLVAAGLNLLAALGALALGRLASPEAGPEAAPAEVSERGSFRLWISLYALSGFIALALEILWFRIVDIGVKSSAFTFGTVLALYLLGATTGALAGSTFAHRVRRPLVVFASLQTALLAWAALAVALLSRLPAEAPGLSWYFAYWGQAAGFKLGTMSDGGSLVRLYVVLPVLLFGIPTILMGLSFPVLQRAVHDDLESGSRRVGLLQAANIAGCTAGSLLVGLVFLDVLGTAGTLRLLVLLGLGFALAAFPRSPRTAVLLAIVIVGSAAVLPTNDALWRRLHGVSEGGYALLEEDATSVVALAPLEVGLFQVFVNGKSHSILPFGVDEHTMLGAVPALVHPNPKAVALIGLGSANTAWAVACRRETEVLDVFEIAGPQLRLLRRFDDERALFPKLGRILHDPRMRVVTADGRNAIERGERRYDIIEADALWPYTGYSGNLYSKEFFARCARHLEPGGLMCTWAPTPRVYATFSRVFPFVLDAGAILVGSLEPIRGTGEEWAERAAEPHAAAWLGPHPVRQIQRVLRRAARLPHRPARDEEVNEDLFPRDELATPE